MSYDSQKITWPGWKTGPMIGQGSFGAVYEIQRDMFGDIEKAALKVISIPQNRSEIDELYSDGYDEESITHTFHEHLQSIVAEYSLMRKMNGNSNIVNCDDVRYVQHEDGIGWDIFIKMELLTPLAKALPADIAEGLVIKIAKDMCGALELCKKYDIVHRDIKPQNIFVSPNGDFKLGDFGIAKTVEKTMGGTKIGTYKYMAPEVYNNQPYGRAADIYSLGLVLYWLLNERRMPFLPLPPEKLKSGMDEQARNRRLAGEPIPAPAHGSEGLKQIVLKACAYDVKDRYASAAELMADLNELCGVVAAPDSEDAVSEMVVEPVEYEEPEEIADAESDDWYEREAFDWDIDDEYDPEESEPEESDGDTGGEDDREDEERNTGSEVAWENEDFDDYPCKESEEENDVGIYVSIGIVGIIAVIICVVAIILREDKQELYVGGEYGVVSDDERTDEASNIMPTGELVESYVPMETEKPKEDILPVMGIVTGGAVNIRADAKAISIDNVVAMAKKDTVLTVMGEYIDEEGDWWYHIAYTNDTEIVTGFARADFIHIFDSDELTADILAEYISAEDISTAEKQPVMRSGIVTANAVKIRAEAATSSAMQGTAVKDTVLTILGEVTGDDGKLWYHVSMGTGTEDEVTGYVRCDLMWKLN